MFLMTLLHRSKVSVDDALNLKRFERSEAVERLERRAASLTP